MTDERAGERATPDAVINELVPPGTPPVPWDPRLSEVRVSVGGDLARRPDREELEATIARTIEERRSDGPRSAHAADDPSWISLAGVAGLDPDARGELLRTIATLVQERHE